MPSRLAEIRERLAKSKTTFAGYPITEYADIAHLLGLLDKIAPHLLVAVEALRRAEIEYRDCPSFRGIVRVSASARVVFEELMEAMR